MADSNESLCKLCEQRPARYTCPRCRVPYCTSACYNSGQHVGCSEDFYRDQVQAQLHDHTAPADSRQKMQEILQRLEQEDQQEEVEEEGIDSDDDEDLADRMKGVDLDDSDAVWTLLTTEERQQFRQLVESGDVTTILPPFVPWWTPEGDEDEDDEAGSKIIELTEEEYQREKSSNARNNEKKNNDGEDLMKLENILKTEKLKDNPTKVNKSSTTKNVKTKKKNCPTITENNSSSKASTPAQKAAKPSSTRRAPVSLLYPCVPPSVSRRYPRAPDPGTAASISALCSRPPAESICYSVVNAVASYCWVTRLFHGLHHEECLEASEAALCLSSVLSGNEVFTSVQEALASINFRASQNPWLCCSEELMQQVTKDVVCVAEGGRALPGFLLHCALADLRVILHAATAQLNSSGTTKHKPAAGTFLASMTGAGQRLKLTLVTQASLKAAVRKLAFLASYTQQRKLDIITEVAMHASL